MALRMAEVGRVCVSEYRLTRVKAPATLLQAALGVLLELPERGARRAVDVHQAGVPVARLTEPAVDVQARELRLVALLLGVEAIRELEHVPRRGRGASGVRREVRGEGGDAAGLGQPDLARNGLQDGRQALGLAPVDVLVVVQAPDAALVLGVADEVLEPLLDRALVEHVS